MVQRKPNPGHPVARWMIETGRRFQEGRRARHERRDRDGDRRRDGQGGGLGRPYTARATVPPGRFRRFLAWCVHTYTAMGLVCAAAIAVLIVRGDALAFQASFGLMVLATIIDATDGTFARKVNVKAVTPNFDGRRLDDLTDFLTYTFLPLFLIWRAGVLPEGWEGWLVLPLLASAYGFCQVSIKTDDGYFLGFPSLWNVVAFYLYALNFDGWVALGLVIFLGLLTFVPIKYLYPSQPGRLNRWSTVLGAGWSVLLVYLIWHLPDLLAPDGDPTVKALGLASLAYPIYYMAASWCVTLHLRSLRTRSLAALRTGEV